MTRYKLAMSPGFRCARAGLLHFARKMQYNAHMPIGRGAALRRAAHARREDRAMFLKNYWYVAGYDHEFAREPLRRVIHREGRPVQIAGSGKPNEAVA